MCGSSCTAVTQSMPSLRRPSFTGCVSFRLHLHCWYSTACAAWVLYLIAIPTACSAWLLLQQQTVINYSLGDRHWNDSAVLQIGNCTDAVLSERGFTIYGSALATGDEWGNIVRFMVCVTLTPRAAG